MPQKCRRVRLLNIVVELQVPKFRSIFQKPVSLAAESVEFPCPFLLSLLFPLLLLLLFFVLCLPLLRPAFDLYIYILFLFLLCIYPLTLLRLLFLLLLPLLLSPTSKLMTSGHCLT